MTAVERADVVLMVIDAVEGVTEQDAKIAGIAHERGKGIIIVVNKWDAIEKNNRTMREYEQEVRRVLSFMPYAEIMYVSALTGQRLVKLYDMIDMVIEIRRCVWRQECSTRSWLRQLPCSSRRQTKEKD